MGKKILPGKNEAKMRRSSMRVKNPNFDLSASIATATVMVSASIPNENDNTSAKTMEKVEEFLGALLDRFEAESPNPTDNSAFLFLSSDDAPSPSSADSLYLPPEEKPEPVRLESMPVQSQRRRKLPRRAREILAGWFDDNVQDPYPSDDEREELIESTGLTSKQIHHWFTNRR
eukprot:CAMPEP_0197522550 /NCGR_PEP_ID=MMETSP1318-20131121/7678_2 /TAXON_ID=552666 /ORGANISM="Partenskyella glossopodia, Strain RCC365" /LENGTH=173 /DNA_ID= /DNA_START= /DNA_END= /DNA_ORIENTATION=